MHILIRSLLEPVFLSSPSGTPIMQVMVCLILSQKTQAIFVLFFILFFHSVLYQCFCLSVFQVTYLFFCFRYSAINSFQCIVHLCLLAF